MPHKFALDASVRSYDVDGRLHIARTRISKATVNPYYGREIPNSEALGLDPNRVYQLLRDPDELARAALSFARNQILVKHIPVSAEDCQREVIGGTVGSNVEFIEPYLWADVCIWDNTAIAGIETHVAREFSAAYRYVLDLTPGTYQGMPYDGVMREIIGNHVCLVEDGRAGSDVLAADEAIKTMKTTKLGKALFVTLGGMSPKLAQDAALLALVGTAGKTINQAELSTKLIAMDAELDPAKLKNQIEVLIALDAEKDDETEEERKKRLAQDEDEDETEEERKKRLAKEKLAEDEEEEEDEKKKKIAQDAALQTAVTGIKKDLREADEARRAVRDVVGEVIAQDSAAEIYGFALDHMKVPHEGVTDVAGRKALFTLANTTRTAAPATRIALDSAGAAAKFPGLDRFRQL